MKMLSKVGLALLVTVMGMVVFTGCEQPGGNGNTWVDQIDWSNHGPANHGFIVDNLSQHRLFVFYGSVHPDTVLGGIPPMANNHGVRRDPGVFGRTRSIHVVVVKEADLIEHVNNGTLAQLSANPFSSLMVMYNHGMPNNHRHRVTERAGGRHRLIVANTTNHNVELRINSPLAGGGDVLGFSPKVSFSTVFHLTDHTPPNVETLVFPVFRFFHPVDQSVSEIFPEWGSGPLQGTPWFRNLPTGAGLPDVNETINVSEVLSNLDITLGAVWIVVENTTNTPITFFQGNSAMPDSMGTFQIPNVMPHNRRTMVFNARGGGGTGTTLPYLNVNNIGVGPTVAIRTNDITTADGDTSFQLLPDHRYRVVVSGSIAAGFTAIINLDGETIDIAELLQDQE